VNIPRQYYVPLVAAAACIYLYMTGGLTAPMLLIAGGLAAVSLYSSEQPIITLEQAEVLAFEEAWRRKTKLRLDEGELRLGKDSGIRERVTPDGVHAWSYLVGLIVYGNTTEQYVSEIGAYGTPLGFWHRPQGFLLSDYPRTETIEMPVNKEENLLKAIAQKVGVI
jgi:hypothetical protein